MPTETTTKRLIDAIALKARLIKYHDGFSEPYDEHTIGMMLAIRDCIDRIDSAQTVETTDDAMARLPDDKYVLEFGKGVAKIYSKWNCFKEGKGNTVSEAISRLEDSIKLG